MNNASSLKQLTSSQIRLAERISAFADIHFDPASWEGSIEPQTSILIAGPTGTGKSFSVRLAASHVGAHYFQATFGSWIPLGAADGLPPTLCHIGMMLLRHQRVVLHLDELDKFEHEDGSWARACQNDLFQILDKRINWEVIVASRRFTKQPHASTNEEAVELLRGKSQQALMIVGSGTWQDLFQERRSPLGFGVPDCDSRMLDTRAKIPGLSPELRRRFHCEVQYLDYPDVEETRRLLNAFGIAALAEELEMPISPESLDWTAVGGLTWLTSLQTDLLAIRKQRQCRVEADTEWIRFADYAAT